MCSFTWRAEGSGTSGLGRDDSQIKTPAFSKLSGLKVGLVLNFNVPVMSNGIVRIVNELKE